VHDQIVSNQPSEAEIADKAREAAKSMLLLPNDGCFLRRWIGSTVALSHTAVIKVKDFEDDGRRQGSSYAGGRSRRYHRPHSNP
jgi:hypothetical protein